MAREPDADMDPLNLVRNFLQALTGDQKDPTFSVAQEYLTEETRKGWIPPGAAWNTRTSIVSGGGFNPTEQPPDGTDHVTRPAQVPEAPASTPVGTLTRVYVPVTEVAQLDEHGFYQADSQPVQKVLEFEVKKEKEEVGWRIQKLPTERSINVDSFKRVYQTSQSALPVYLPGSGDLAVDQVYLTQATGKVEYSYNALAEAVLNGRSPAQASPLQLDKTRPVAVDAQGLATVTLTLPPGGGTKDLDGVQDALLRTFSAAAASPQLVGSTPQLQKVQVTYAGCVSTCVAHDVSTPVTGTSPLVYWVCPEANGHSTIVSRSPIPGSGSACGDPGHAVITMDPVVKGSPIAVRQPRDAARDRPQTSGTAVVVAAIVKKPDGSGAVMVTDKRNPESHVWYKASDPTKVTDIEWDPVDGSLWVVDDHQLFRVRDPGDKQAGADSQDPVDVPADPQLTAFKPSPDGTRAVVVTDAAAASGGAVKPWPAAIVTIARGTATPRLEGPDTLLMSGPTSELAIGQSTSGVLIRATDAAWVDGRTVVLIGVFGSANTLSVVKVYADGTQDSLIGDPEDAQPAARHISAAISVNGHQGIWIFSDGAGPAAQDGPVGSNVYFKGRSSAESYQDSGWSPVVAVTVPDPGQ